MPRNGGFIGRRLLALVCAVVVLCASGHAWAEEAASSEADVAQEAADSGGGFADGAYKAFDAVFLRPSGALVIAVGAVLLVPASIMTLPSGWESVTYGYEVFVSSYMVQRTFERPLGKK